MMGMVWSSQVEQYESLGNLFLVLAAVFGLTAVIYGIRIHIVRILQKQFGIEKRREIARMRRKGNKTTDRMYAALVTGGRASGSMTAQGGRLSARISLAVSPQAGGEQQRAAVPQAAPEERAEPHGAAVQQKVLEETRGRKISEETTVLESEETVVLTAEERNRFCRKKDVVVVHGEDIF